MNLDVQGLWKHRALGAPILSFGWFSLQQLGFGAPCLEYKTKRAPFEKVYWKKKTVY